MTDYLAFRKLRRSISTMAALAVVAAFAGYGTHNAAAVEMSPAAKAVVDYDKSGVKPKKKYRIAYLTECVDNPYCLARLAGLKAAAEKYGFEFKIFDANFNPATQAKVVENAVTEGFDGYLFGPAAAQPGCGLYKRLLKPTGKPVVSLDIAMCGDPDYTPGLAATLDDAGSGALQRVHGPRLFVLQGQLHSGGGRRLRRLRSVHLLGERDQERRAKKYPERESRRGRAGQFRSAHRARRRSRSALLAHPDISIVISSWDDMSRGVEQAVIAAGKTPGKDVMIFSGGATKVGVDKVKAGTWRRPRLICPIRKPITARSL